MRIELSYKMRDNKMNELKAKEIMNVAGGINGRDVARGAGAVIGDVAGKAACAGLNPLIISVCGRAGAAAGTVVGDAIYDAATAPTYQGQPPASSYPTDLPTNPGGEPRYNWDTASAGDGGSTYAQTGYSDDSSSSSSADMSGDSIGGAGAHYHPDQLGAYVLNHDRSTDFL